MLNNILKLSMIEEDKPKNFLTKIIYSEYREYLAYGLMVIVDFLWVIFWVYPSQHNYSFFQTNLTRGIALFWLSKLIAYFYDFDTDLKDSHDVYWLNIRHMILLFYGFMFAFSQLFLPLPIIHILGASGNLFIFIWDYYLNGVTVNKEQLKGIIVGAIGLLLAINGPFLMKMINPNYKIKSNFENYKTSNIYVMTIVACGLCFACICWAYAIVITKKLRNTNAIQTSFHFGMILLLGSALLYPLIESEVDLKTLALGLVLSGIPSALCQLFLIGSLMLSPNTGILTLTHFTNIIWAYLLSMLRYNEEQNIFCSIGVVLIVGGVSKTLFSKKDKKQAKQ